MFMGCREDLNYFCTTKVDGHSDPEVKNRLQNVAESGFRRITYTEAIDILQKAIQEYKPSKKGDKLFEFEVNICPSSPASALDMESKQILLQTVKTYVLV